MIGKMKVISKISGELQERMLRSIAKAIEAKAVRLRNKASLEMQERG